MMRPADGADHVAPPVEERSYQIGTVSTLTGLDPHTIRAWERRYGAIEPSRTATGRRRYDDLTVERLLLLKALVDCQESIGTIANLPDSDLRARLEKLADLGKGRPRESDAVRGPGCWRMALMAPGLEAQLRANAVALPELEVSLSVREREALLTAARGAPCEVVVLELDAVGASPLGFVQACRALPGSPLVVVLYRFAQRAALARLAQAGAKLVQTPLRLEQLRRAILDHLVIEQVRERRTPMASPRFDEDAAAEPARSAARRFDDAQLARLFEVSTGIDCECPNHLSSLVSALVAFETYSRGCEFRDEADQRLHRRLADGTAEARAQLEDLLAELCDQEGIVV
jgi:DNA-binding transcriptional MerR regulator